MSKSEKKQFLLEEENGTIYTRLKVEGGHGMEMRITDVPNVRIRQRKPTKEHLDVMSELRIAVPHIQTSEKWLSWYKTGMNNQIIDELQLIRKSMKRIQGLVYCIELTEKLQVEKAK